MEGQIVTKKVELTDAEALLRSLNDDPKAFEIIVERYEEAFLRKARKILRGREGAEDIVQETFVKIYVHGRKFQPVEGASFQSWAYKILLNTSFSYLKKEHSSDISLSEELSEILPDTRPEFEEKLSTDYCLRILSKMPTLLASSLRKFFLEGKSGKEIALEEGISLGAFRARIHRAKKEFKKIALKMV